MQIVELPAVGLKMAVHRSDNFFLQERFFAVLPTECPDMWPEHSRSLEEDSLWFW